MIFSSRNLGLLLMVLLFCLSSCAQRPGWHKPVEGKTVEPAKTATAIPRADPSYLHQLEKRSMLGSSVEMARIVSGSNLGWRATPSGSGPQTMLDYADSWLALNPSMLVVDSRSTTLEYMGTSRFWGAVREAGVKGVYLAPTGGSGRMWATNGTDDGTREDVVSYTFAPEVGDDDRYFRMMRRFIDEHALVGSDLVPAATGLGPDFFLAARNVREYPGAYCLVDVPQELWNHLPPVESEWKGAPLTPAQVAALSKEGVLPEALVGNPTHQGGWAATAAITGVDAMARRWVYRYHGAPAYAVLNWEDPSRAANRILSGSAVRQVGMLGQSLVGMKFDAFHGLEVAPDATRRLSFSGLGPAASAAQTMGREINRYGGWSWLRNADLTLDGMRRFLQSDVDFVTDNALSPAVEHALLTGNATFLRYMGAELVKSGIDARRLVHTMPAEYGVSYTLPTLQARAADGDETAKNLLAQVTQEYRASAGRQAGMPVKNNVLYTTGAGLAAMGLGQQADASSSSKNIEQGHFLLVLFKAMQPGVLMLGGQDLVGAMPLNPATMGNSEIPWDISFTSRGSYSLTTVSSFASSGQSIARTTTAYGPADEQGFKKGAFISKIGELLKARTGSGVAKGRLVAYPETKTPGVAVAITEIAPGRFMVTAANFSRQGVTESVDVGKLGLSAGNVSSFIGSGSVNRDGNRVVFSFGPWEGKAAIMGATGSI